MANEAAIELDKIAATTISVPIIGTSPLIVNNFSEKAKRQMLDAQQGKKKVKELRDPQAEYSGSLYRIDRGDGVERYGFPAAGFKKATVAACRFFGKALPMSQAKQALFFSGVYTPADPQQLVEIEGEPTMRQDTVRLAGIGRTSDLRFRAQFVEWRADLQVTFVSSMLSTDSVLSLIDAGGMCCGVGEWRVERGGDFGKYRIDPDGEITGI
ncbi:hypothetical protein QP568_09735 [Propionimicrobium lymphophilum]|uniref:Uncharacterized protein n=1 Tax=Propionimicrobium lymphophilum ACS-093-V-SCH5 TaxID=883161 RepID=S2W1A7_9ACTN|nr:hypothetical protein [Propionimicrobium lymphophilum]EPD32931.1 hypothetical protein HMPREF9306_01239 [Propionimicrobium lymphophilum ACS-093-V-SCH5]MDK7710632.1 hypothetical protein [Propionimicrobium lymphophilum]MDK7734563.1 hypothetical protein [Propionimicrobium lymphophilum]